MCETYPPVLKFFAAQPAIVIRYPLIGPDSICSFERVIDFKVVKNAGCNAAAIWQIDNNDADIIATTNSTMKLNFKKSGTIQIVASITSGCTGLTAQKTVFVNRPASSVNLGADTVLCTNNTYALNAGSGFKSYAWSHTNVADSQVTITNPVFTN